MTKPSIRTLSLLTLAMLFLCGVVGANFPTLAQRLPPTTGAIVAVNVARLVQSPFGKNAQWGERLAQAWADQPVMIPPGAQRVLMAADVKPSSMESYWEMSLIEMDKVPSLESIAKAEGGHIDRVWDKDAVCSPINAYFLPMEGNVLASITPAERSQVARWVRQPVKPEGYVTSEYIKSVLAKLSNDTDVVMAMDLEGAYGVPAIRRWLDLSEIPEVNDKNIDKVVRVLGTMQGITLEIRVTDKIMGKATVPFDQDASALKDCAKPIMIELLNYCGMKIEEVPQWKFDAMGKQVTMEGELSNASLRRLLSIVQTPVPAVVTAEPKAAVSPADPAQASVKYYKTICAILDNVQGGKSPSETATWIRAASKRIDQLPILNVDPALVEWGGMISSRLKQAGGVAAVGQTQINARVAGVADPDYVYAYDNQGNYTDSASNRVARENANKERRAAALEQKAQSQQQALQIINDITETRPKIRADMVAKYHVEF